MMRKLSLLIACFAVCMGLVAQDKKVAISSATTSSYHNGNGADKAIDGEISTIWHSGNNGDGYNTTFPVTFTITFGGANHVNYVRYVPRTDLSNGNWEEVKVEYCSSTSGSNFVTVGTFDLGGSGSSYDFYLNGDAGVTCGQVRFTINSGKDGWASAAEIEAYAYAYDTEKPAAFAQYFTDGLYTQLKSGVTSSDGIADADVKALVEAMLADAEGYKKFRVGEYEPYMTTATVRNSLKTNSLYNNYENPTGIYLKRGESCIIAVSGIGNYPVGLKIKDWYKSGDLSSYKLRNGLNYITATTEGNVFVDYYTDDFKNAPNVQMHFINAPVLGYWDQATMTNADWEAMLAGPLTEDDEVIIITRSEHAQTAYPVKQWKTYCPTDVNSTMTYYQQVQWAERDILGLEMFGRQVKNRQLFYADKTGSMYAGGDASVCGYGDLRVLVTPDAKVFDFWGVGHEWGHNNQMAGFHWTGCGETTNNIPASWAQFKFTGNRDANGNPTNLRLEDEVTGINDYKGMRGGRMQTYFEEGLRKGVQWQLQDGPDWHAETPTAVTVPGHDENGNDIGQVTTTWRHYDHFVKLAPFWQLNLWGTVANKNPYIITKVIESIRTTDNYTSTYNTNGKQQINWMKLACEAARTDLLPFFEKAGMLRPIHAYVDDYAKGWNIITEEMIDELKASVAAEVAAGRYKAYPDEEINYINGHNYHIYRDKLKLNVASMQGTLNGDKVKILHSVAQNAVAFETYNVQDELIRITMYGLGSDDEHSYTQVLFPSSLDESQDAAYIMAVGYNGDRQEVYRRYSSEEDALEQRLGRLLSDAKAILDMEDATLTKVGYYKIASLTELKSVYNTTKEVYDNKTYASYADVYNQLFAEYEAIVNDEDARIGVIEGYAYRLQNKLYATRYMSVVWESEESVYKMWGEEAEVTENQKWYFETAETEGCYYLRNKATKTYPGDVVRSGKLNVDKTKDEAQAYMLKDMGNGLWALVGSLGLHCGAWNYDYRVLGWDADADASQWYITEVEKDPEVEALIEARYNLTSLIKDMNNLIAETGEVKDLGTKDVDLSEDSYYTNAPCVNPPYDTDKFTSFSVLYDNNPSTFLHTDYSGQAPAEDHYIRMDVGENNPLRYFQLRYQLRSAGAENMHAPTKFAVEGSNDLNSWTMIRDITSGLPTESGANHTTELLGDSYHTYRYVRMRVYETSTGRKENEHYCFALSELGLSRMDYVLNINSQFAAMEEGVLLEAFLAMQKAQETLETAKKKEDVDAAIEELKAQYDALDKARSDAAGIIPVTKITLDKTTVSLVEGESTPLIATVTPDNATNKTVTWSSSNKAVAIVDANGKVTAVAAGEATITAKAGRITATCEVTVEKKVIAVEGISLNRTSVALVEGETLTLVATVTPDNATDKTVTWSSSNAAVAAVDATGKVTAVAAGKATITAKAGDKTAICEVTVEKKVIPVEGISLNRTSAALVEGETLTLVATVTPDNATDKTVTWNSSNAAIAAVDATGKVTAVAAGKATITAKAGDKTAICEVTVEKKVIPVEGISLNRTSAALVEGETLTLVATVTPDNATDKTVTWSSSNAAVATVDATGKVSAVSVGTATITAKAGEKTATCEVTVEKKVIPVEGISLNRTSAALVEGETLTLVATVTPAEATDKTVTWSSSNAAVATVDATGKVSAVSVGTATITAKAGEKTATCEVTVEMKVIPVEGISLNRTSAALVEGETLTLVATVTPENATDKTVTWSSSNASVATVDATGKVTAVAVGSATITAKAGEKTATCEVTVEKKVIPVDGISLNRTSASLVEGESLTLVATVTPDNATDKTVTWSSSNAAVAAVDATGKVTAVTVGTATITAKAGEKTAICEVTVEKKVIPVDGISLNRTSASLVEGETLTLVATVTPDNATDKTVTWSSSNAAVATVDATGKVSAVSVGTATITAKAGEKTAICEVTVEKKIIPVEGISLNRTSAALVEGETLTLVATVTPDNATDKTVTWSSSNAAVAAVDATGKVTAVTVGTATITAKAGEITATCVVTVEKKVIPVEGISLNRTSAALVEGESLALVATVTPEDATDKTVTWSSSNAAVATVDATGKVSAVAVGTATITAKAGEKTATCEVTVEKKVIPVEGISLNRTSAALVEGETLTLVATVTPAEATDKTVTWSSSNAAVATVDATGKVSAVSVGTATITAKAGEKTATCEVTVEKKVIPVEGISLNRTSAALVEGETLTLVATVTPAEATDKTVTWSSSNAAVATVDATGKVSAVAVGTATITAKAGDKTATCEVTVDRKVIDVEGISLDVTSVELTRGDSLTIHATVYPADATDKTVAWSSSNEAVACVNSDGTVVALSAGTAIITATSNGYEASCLVVVNEVNGIDLLLMDGSWPVDIYDVTGRIVRKNAYSITDLEEGFYFINGRKYFINK